MMPNVGLCCADLVSVSTSQSRVCDNEAYGSIICCPSSAALFHSGASAIGLIPATIFILFSGELLLLRLGIGLAFCCTGIECNTKGGCLVASHEIPAVFSAGTLTSSQRSSCSRSSRSSSEMWELACLPQKEDKGVKMSRFGQSGYAQLAKDELERDGVGAAGDKQESEEAVDVDDTGEKLKSDDMVEGGDSGDLNGMLIASTKAREGKILRAGEAKGECAPLLLLGDMLSRSCCGEEQVM